MKVNGKETTWMDKESLSGLMVKSMKVNINTIKNMDSEFSPGQMVANIPVNGIMANNVALDTIELSMVS